MWGVLPYAIALKVRIEAIRLKAGPMMNLGDMRDVADLHLRAMTDPKAAGERFLATSGGSLWMVEVARLLKDRLGPVAAKVSTREYADRSR